MKVNRIVSMIVSVCFLLNAVVTDITLAQENSYRSNVDNLATLSRTSNLLDQQVSDMTKIDYALREQIAALRNSGKIVNSENLSRAGFFNERSGIQFFRHETENTSEGLCVRVRFQDEIGTRTYYVIISAQKSEDEGLPVVKIYSEEQYIGSGVSKIITPSTSVSREQGYSVYALTNGSGNSMEVVPGMSGTVRSMKIGGTEILYYPEGQITSDGGVPSPFFFFANRVAGGKFNWNGKTYDLSQYFDQNRGLRNDGNGNALHGILQKEAWEVESSGVMEDGSVYIALTYDAGKNKLFTDVFGKDASAKLRVKYILQGSELCIEMSFNNDGQVEFPFSTAVHPWIRRDAGTTASIPANSHWKADNCLPRQLEDVNSAYDLRKPTLLDKEQGGVVYDDAFTGLTRDSSGNAVSTIKRSDGVSVEVRQDAGFSHTLLWTGQDGNVSIEPQTGANNVLNMAGDSNAGFKTLKPGENWNGVVVIGVSKPPAPAMVAAPGRLTKEGLENFRAFPNRFIEGQLWAPTKSLSEPLEPRNIGGTVFPQRVDKRGMRSQDQIQRFVNANSPKVFGMQRFIDVGGSSIDLRALQKLLNKLGINALDFITSTTVVAGDFPLSLEVVPAESSDGKYDPHKVIQYTIEYTKIENGEKVKKIKTYTVYRGDDGYMATLMPSGKRRSFIAPADGEYELWNGGKARLRKGQIIDGQMGAFAYFMSQVGAFGVRGIFRTLQPIAEAGGLGRSGGSNAMFIAMAGVLAGVELTKADVQAEAVEKEGNGEDDALAVLGGYTGGQESGATLLGGANQMIHLTEVKNASGDYVWPVGTEFIVPLAGSTKEVNNRMLSHVALVQPGLPFKDAVPQIRRTAGGINTTWCARAKYPEDKEGLKLHAMKTLVAMVAAYGIAHDRWDLVIWSQNEHRRIRNELDKGFYEFAIQALENVEGRPEFADVYLHILEDDSILNKYLGWHKSGKDDKSRPFDLRKVSLYSMTQDPLIQEVTRVVREITGKEKLELTDLDSPAAVFIPGAGGTGSPAVIVTNTPEMLQKILAEIKLDDDQGGKASLQKFKPDDVLKVMGGTGLLQGYLQPEAGEAIRFEGLPPDAKTTKEGLLGVYDQTTGVFYVEGDGSDIPKEVLALPRVKLLSDSPEIENAYTTQMASKAGLEIPTHPDKRYTLLVTSEFFADGELKEHKETYGDRFNVDAVSGRTADELINNVLSNANVKSGRTVVLLPDQPARGNFETRHFEALKAAGIRFVAANRSELLKARADNDSYRMKFQRDAYAVMLLVRSIDNTTAVDSPIYRLLNFYARTHFTLPDGIGAGDYVRAIATDNLAMLMVIKACLTYEPFGKHDLPDYNNVAATLVSA